MIYIAGADNLRNLSWVRLERIVVWNGNYDYFHPPESVDWAVPWWGRAIFVFIILIVPMIVYVRTLCKKIVRIRPSSNRWILRVVQYT